MDWVTADLADPDGLARALDGADRLFLLTGNTADMVRSQKNAIAAAESVGVRHVVKVSALGASDHSISVIGVWHWVVEQVLIRARLDWTILRPHVFMQNVLSQADAIREGRVHSASGDAAVPMIDTRDIAAVAAAALTGDGHAGERYTLTGPQPVNWHDVARTLSEVLGHAVDYIPETEDDAWRRLHGGGAPAWLVAGQLALAEYQRRGGGTGIVTDTVERITGRPPRTLGDFVRDHAHAFGADA